MHCVDVCVDTASAVSMTAEGGSVFSCRMLWRKARLSRRCVGQRRMAR